MFLLKYFFLLFVVVEARIELVGYYEDLIREGIKMSKKYVFPKDAGAFRPKQPGNKPLYFGTFNYVVIGGGSAGAVVASGLSEETSWTVLLLEAGQPENNFTDIPAMSQYTVLSDYNWGFNSTPQTTCCLATEGVCAYPRGRALGGSTVLNALIYSRGNAIDYDEWSRAGNPGWSYEEVLPFFTRSEKSYINGDSGYHGFNGPLHVDYYKSSSQRSQAFLRANCEKGLQVGDYNGACQLKTSPTQFNVLNGKRLSSATAFLQPAKNRTNLHVLTGSYVTKIVTSGKMRRVRRVVFSLNNVEYYVKVSKEAILSAGVFGSPHLLMVSGVGPTEDLKQLGIPAVVNLDVGKTLHDHLTFYNLYFETVIDERAYTLKQAIEDYLKGRGLLTISTNPQALSFHLLSNANSSVPDFEIVMVPSVNNFEKEDQINGGGFQMVLVLLHPKTRGSVFLQSGDPYVYPLIDSKCLWHPQDLAKVLKGIQIVLELVATDAFRRFKPRLVPYEPCVSHGYLSEEYWTCVVRQTSTNAFHGGGTCRMGPSPSHGDVVDSNLKVYGISNLRVADASVVPTTLSAHMSAPAMMIGEKVSDLIKKANNVV